MATIKLTARLAGDGRLYVTLPKWTRWGLSRLDGRRVILVPVNAAAEDDSEDSEGEDSEGADALDGHPDGCLCDAHVDSRTGLSTWREK